MRVHLYKLSTVEHVPAIQASISASDPICRLHLQAPLHTLVVHSAHGSDMDDRSATSGLKQLQQTHSNVPFPSLLSGGAKNMR